ncbi:RNA-binding S4 domain-containing protein [Corynebacterium anserum]|uniref:RNA-binding protein n=1 Tax=Corynebacterium anserum TaxID=2684406 RepID=A0A7G7YLJ3_9CORY|nr:RNA-binding S4 domain-containing protein [Corynebacterium anserum]MBC2682593.1 RNA-binding protein [Corynebacterium anserum]QNH95363.1 RNA-binding protein [Corynebacterium anserum]
MQIQDVTIRDQEIRLGQFVKLANLVETGGVAKELIASGAVTVNGQVDTRRGKVLHIGDEVGVLDLDTQKIIAAARVVSEHGADYDDDELGEYFDEATADDDFDPEKWRNM